MNTDVRYLQQLERDLEEVAEVELAHIQDERLRAIAGAGGGRETESNRRTRRGIRWPAVAAAVVAALVLAGGVGFVAQNRNQAQLRELDTADSGAGPSATSAPAPEAPGHDQSATGTGGFIDLPDSGRYHVFAGLDRTPGDGRSDSIVGDGTATGSQSDLSKIIRDGRIDVEIANGTFAKNVTAVTRIATENGGFVLTSSTQEGRAGTFTLRIPAKRFDATMDRLRSRGTVKADAVTGEDVTAEFIDLQARLEILIDRRELLRGLQADATSSSEILRFATLIDRVQLDIERIQGELNFIRDQVAEATIRVSLHEQDAPAAEAGAGDVDKPSLGTSLELAAQGFLRVIGAIVVGLGYLIPVAVVAGIGWLVVVQVRRRGRATA